MTPSEAINDLFRQKVCWLSDSGPDDDIAISSRIRFARNLADYDFPIQAADTALCEIRDQVLDCLRHISVSEKIPVREFPMDEISVLDRKFLMERHLISREFVNPRNGAALVTSREQGTFVMINEEDHLRIQVLAPGFQLDSLWDRIDHLDDLLSESLPFAYDKRLGYLTACPTNLGTAMRASVMLHLPGLALTNQIETCVQAIGKLGLTVRGLFGEGSKNQGNFYQISNQSSLGESEQEIIRRLSAIIGQIITNEKKARSLLLASKRSFLLNHVSRAYGLLQHSYLISGSEALEALSALRLGVDMGMFQELKIHTVNELFLLVQRAHLQKYSERELDQNERDEVRASLLREYLAR